MGIRRGLSIRVMGSSQGISPKLIFRKLECEIRVRGGWGKRRQSLLWAKAVGLTLLGCPLSGPEALPPETIPERGELEGQTPSKENLEKDLREDTGVTRTLLSQEPELLQNRGEY